MISYCDILAWPFAFSLVFEIQQGLCIHEILKGDQSQVEHYYYSRLRMHLSRSIGMITVVDYLSV